MREGVLTRELVLRDDAGRETRVRSRRIVHMEQPNLAAIEYSITPENWAGRVEVRSLLDGAVVNAGVPRYRELGVEAFRRSWTWAHEVIGDWLLVRTAQSRLEVGLVGAHARLARRRARSTVERRLVEEPERIGTELSFGVEQGETVAVEKVVALYTSRDPGISEAEPRGPGGSRARRALRGAPAHARARVEGALAALRHPARARRRRADRSCACTSSTCCRRPASHSIGLDVGVPARGWHGEAYRGHVFWDELFVFPFFNLRFSMITRSLLLYRYRRLNAARRAARADGLPGRDVPVAERQQRPGGDAGAAPQPRSRHVGRPTSAASSGT